MKKIELAQGLWNGMNQEDTDIYYSPKQAISERNTQNEQSDGRTEELR